MIITIDNAPLEFGKHKGKTSEEISEKDQRYIMWMYETITPKRCSKELYEACRQDVEEEDFIYELQWDIDP